MAHRRAARLFVVLAALGTGCGGSGGGGGPSLIDILGIVVNGFGVPTPGVQVFVIGHPSTVSDASGQFTVLDVQVPYDVVTVIDDGVSGPKILVMRGLT